MNRIGNAFSIGNGTAIGVLLHSRFLSAAHELDWQRTLFIGIFCGISAAIWPRKKTK